MQLAISSMNGTSASEKAAVFAAAGLGFCRRPPVAARLSWRQVPDNRAGAESLTAGDQLTAVQIEPTAVL